jgi:hypothetical protein
VRPIEFEFAENQIPVYPATDAVFIAKFCDFNLLKDGAQTSSDLARKLNVNESALYRILRLMASQSVFEETNPGVFANTELSQFYAQEFPAQFDPC